MPDRSLDNLPGGGLSSGAGPMPHSAVPMPHSAVPMPHSDVFWLAVTAAPCGIAVCSEDGRILFANHSLGLIFGCSAEELLGSSFDDLVPECRSARSDFGEGSPHQTVPRAVGTKGQLAGCRKDGGCIAVDVCLLPASYESQPAFVAQVVDVTPLQDLKAQLDRDTRFDQALAEIAARFVAAPAERLDETIVDSQRRLAELIGAERSALWQLAGDGDDLVYTHVWSAHPAMELPLPEDLPAQQHFPWVLSELREGRSVSFASTTEIASPIDRKSFDALGAKSHVSVPLLVGGKMVGVLTFATVSAERSWSGSVVDRLQLAASVFAHTLDHQADRQALEAALAELRHLRDQLAHENVHLRREVRSLRGPRVLAAESIAAQQVLAQIEQVAPTPATVLILGETGSGKEVFAEELHALSPRRQKPMVRVNCAAIPTALIESELFGRERGAYTGALSRQLGRFEVADGSTIFLDEVGDLPLEIQVKLLRVLQDHVIERLGSSQRIKVNVRVIAATHRDLEQAVADRTFREDLYYRLNVFPIRVPPLRERVEDIPALVWSFINEFAASFGRNIESLSKHSLQGLQAYSWPGNIRELRNIVERAMICATGPVLVIEPPRPSTVMKRKSLKFEDVEIDHLRSVLESTGWRIRGPGGAADVLGMKPTTLESRMAKLGLVRAHRSAVAADRP